MLGCHCEELSDEAIRKPSKRIATGAAAPSQ